MTTTYTLTVPQCKALLLHIPKSDVRYYLVGLHLCPDGIASATDGRRALRVRVEMDGPGVSAIVPRELVERAAKGKTKAVVFKVDGTSVTLVPDNLTAPLVDGKFPEIERVCPMLNKPGLVPSTSGFNLDHHLDARRAVDLLEIGKPGKFAAPIPFKSQGPEDDLPGFHYGDQYAMVVMPMRK